MTRNVLQWGIFFFKKFSWQYSKFLLEKGSPFSGSKLGLNLVYHATRELRFFFRILCIWTSQELWQSQNLFWSYSDLKKAFFENRYILCCVFVSKKSIKSLCFFSYFNKFKNNNKNGIYKCKLNLKIIYKIFNTSFNLFLHIYK